MLPENKCGSESGAHKSKQLHKDGQRGLWSSNVQDMERAGSCGKRQLYVSQSSVTYSSTGRSPTQIAPSLRHGHRNASAIHCSCPEQQARLQRGEPGNPHSLHRLKPVSSPRVPEERTKRGVQQLPRHFIHFSKFLKRDTAAVRDSSVWGEGPPLL